MLGLLPSITNKIDRLVLPLLILSPDPSLNVSNDLIKWLVKQVHRLEMVFFLL